MAGARGGEGGGNPVVTATETKFGKGLGRAREAGRAVGAFTCYDLLGFEAVVRAAESFRAPVIVLVSPASFSAEGGERLVRAFGAAARSEEHTSELQSRPYLVCRLLLEKKTQRQIGRV